LTTNKKGVKNSRSLAFINSLSYTGVSLLNEVEDEERCLEENTEEEKAIILESTSFIVK